MDLGSLAGRQSRFTVRHDGECGNDNRRKMNLGKILLNSSVWVLQIGNSFLSGGGSTQSALACPSACPGGGYNAMQSTKKRQNQKSRHKHQKLEKSGGSSSKGRRNKNPNVSSRKEKVRKVKLELFRAPFLLRNPKFRETVQL